MLWGTLLLEGNYEVILLYVEAGKITVSISNLEFEMFFHVDAVR